MTPQQRQEITRYLESFDFAGLFTDASIGWDWPEGGESLNVPTKEGYQKLAVVAEKRGVKVLCVPPRDDGSLPASSERRALEKAVRPLAAEHLLIFTDAAKTRQIWQWTQHSPGKPVSFREITWEKGKANELLLQKLSSISFTLDEEDGLDITGVVHRLTDQLNRDTVTKRFYDQFKKQKDAFAKFIDGIDNKDILAHYTSLMLNRIMFCYFLQRKGFLDGDHDYLRNRLQSIQDQVGANQFHSFYRSFLRRLFHEGLGGHPDARSKEFAKLIGDVPYLNGGIFDEHPIERNHPQIQIPDEAFEKVFAFFDQYDWHLDERPIAGGNEINPEILGYVFEKYTNQKEMGAYYTKEDITEYISKNCIIPFIFNAVGKKLPDFVWELIKENPDRYIYEAVRRGAGESEEAWEASLPKEIRQGLRPDTLQQVVELDKPVLTLERRKHWNTPTPASHCLPTEIWRETIARHQRCHELRRKLRSGEVRSIDDFITLNLNIRQFAQDVVESADASLLLAFFKQLKQVSVLDPTCGSGAFLFAALEILQPLYLACLERMRVLLADWQSNGESHPNWEKEIRSILDQAGDHSNEAYYIHKTIIVHNLYGVDIMEEAVEICKLRLFLKLAAQLEPGQQVEPLPDIDFNVRSGNTLVGYASKEEIQRAFTEHQGGGGGSQQLLQGIEHSLDDYRHILEQAEDADRAFQRFHALQEDTGAKPEHFRAAKQELNRILDGLRDQLDHFLSGDYDQKNLQSDKKFEAWRKSHEPFHWFIEFYGIMNKGGFDVIIGNPPYLVYPSKVNYRLLENQYESIDCKNLYGLVFERADHLAAKSTYIGLIVQMTVMSAGKMKALQESISNGSTLYCLPFPRRPESIFDGVEMPVAIVIRGSDKNASANDYVTARVGRMYGSERSTAIDCINLASHSVRVNGMRIAKFGLELDNRIFNKARRSSDQIERVVVKNSDHSVYYQEACRYWLKASHRVPYFCRNGETILPPHGRTIHCDSKKSAAEVTCVLNSSLFYWFYSCFSDCEHVNDQLVKDWRRPRQGQQQDWLPLAEKLLDDMQSNAARKTINTKQNHVIEYDEISASSSKPIIDEIDTVLAAHYGFTEEELDFIINYDIKYRMGLGG